VRLRTLKYYKSYASKYELQKSGNINNGIFQLVTNQECWGGASVTSPQEVSVIPEHFFYGHANKRTFGTNECDSRENQIIEG